MTMRYLGLTVGRYPPAGIPMFMSPSRITYYEEDGIYFKSAYWGDIPCTVELYFQTRTTQVSHVSIVFDLIAIRRNSWAYRLVLEDSKEISKYLMMEELQR